MSRPLRVVHLVHSFPPEFRGGTEQYLSELVRLQRTADLEVAVVTGSARRDDAAATSREEWHGVPVTRVHRRHDEPFGVHFEPPQALAAALAAVHACAPDVVHLHHWFNLGDRLLARLAPLPAVVSLHDAYAACPRFFFLRPDGFFCGSDLPVPVARCVDCLRPDDGHADLGARIAARRTTFAAELDRAHVVLAPSEFHAELLVKAGLVPSEKMQSLALGLARVPARAAHRPAPGRLRLVSFGNLSKLKGSDLLLDAVRLLAQRGGVELHFFGEPLPAEATDLRAAAAGLPVTWHGEYDLARLASMAPAFDLAVFPSRAYETYSLVVEEAIALGLPLVVSDRGAPARRVVPFGVAVPVDTVAPLCVTLSQLMDDPQRLAAMRAALPPGPQLLADHERALRRHYLAAVAAAQSGAT